YARPDQCLAKVEHYAAHHCQHFEMPRKGPRPSASMPAHDPDEHVAIGDHREGGRARGSGHGRRRTHGLARQHREPGNERVELGHRRGFVCLIDALFELVHREMVAREVAAQTLHDLLALHGGRRERDRGRLWAHRRLANRSPETYTVDDTRDMMPGRSRPPASAALGVRPGAAAYLPNAR